MIKTTAPYQLPQYKTLKLVVENRNPVMAKERTHSRAQEQRSSRAPVQNVDVDEDNEEEEWHLDAEENEIENAMDVEEIVKEW
jgi:hypothetical protein